MAARRYEISLRVMKIFHSFAALTLWGTTRSLCEQGFLSCMAFTVYEVVRVVCLSRKSHAREEPLLAGYDREK